MLGNFPLIFWNPTKCWVIGSLFFANRLERTHFVILAELSPKKADINFDTYSSRKIEVWVPSSIPGRYIFFFKRIFYSGFPGKPYIFSAKFLTFCRCASFPTELSGKNPTFFVERIDWTHSGGSVKAWDALSHSISPCLPLRWFEAHNRNNGGAPFDFEKIAGIRWKCLR